MRSIIILFLFVVTLPASSANQKEFDTESAWQEFTHNFTQNYAYQNSTGVDTAKLLAR